MKILFLVENLETLTATNLVEAACKTGYEIDVIPYFKDGINQCSIVKRNRRQALFFNNRVYQPREYSGAFLWSWGTAPLGRRYLKVFEDQGVPVLNSTYCTKITDSKIRLTKKLKQSNISTPRTAFFENGDLDNVDRIGEQLGPVPYVFKPDYGTQGIGIGFASSLDELRPMAANLREQIPDNNGFIVQEFIGDPRVPIHHLRVFVVGDYAIPMAIKVTATTPMKVSNVAAGGKVEFIKPCPEIIKLATRAARVTGLNVAGVDLMVHQENGQERFYILEVNDGPGTKIFDKAGYKASEMVIDYFIKAIQQPKIA